MDYPTSGRGITVLVVALLLLAVFLITSGLAPLLLAAAVIVPVAYLLYVVAVRVDRWLKGRPLRRRGGGG